MSDFETLSKKALSELLKEGKIAKHDDVYSYSGSSKKEPEKPEKPPKPTKPTKTPPNTPPPPRELPPVVKDQVLTKDLIDVIASDANIFYLGLFLGYSEAEIKNIVYERTKYTVTTSLPPGASAAVDEHRNMLINRDDFNYILKYYSSEKKPVSYWFKIYIFAHEFIHILTRTDPEPDPQRKGWSLDEAIVPIIEYEFYVNFNGALNPHLIDLCETNFDRMSHKRKGLVRIEVYGPYVYFFFDQLVAFDSLYPKAFIKAMREYAKSPPTYKTKFAILKKYYPFEEK